MATHASDCAITNIFMLPSFDNLDVDAFLACKTLLSVLAHVQYCADASCRLNQQLTSCAILMYQPEYGLYSWDTIHCIPPQEYFGSELAFSNPYQMGADLTPHPPVGYWIQDSDSWSEVRH